jgi:hypothetical protein
MASSPRVSTVPAIALTFAAALVVPALGQDEAPGGANAQALAADGRRVVVWVRPASDEEMRLSPEAAPALRRLAQSGVSFPALGADAGGEVVAALRKLGAELSAERLFGPAFEGCFREVGAPANAPVRSDPLAELVARFGKPPPVSKEEAEAVARLRRASGSKRDRGLEVDEAGAGDSERTPASAGNETTAAAVWTAEVASAFSGGARLVLRIDRVDAALPARGEDRRAADRTLEALAEEIGGVEGRNASVLIVVLVPPSGPPALIAAGGGFRNGRVVRKQPSAADIAAGVGRLVGGSSAIELASGGDAAWLAAALVRNEGGAP